MYVCMYVRHFTPFSPALAGTPPRAPPPMMMSPSMQASAVSAAQPPKERFAPDGRMYSLREFCDFYGNTEGRWKWDCASPVARDPAVTSVTRAEFMSQLKIYDGKVANVEAMLLHERTPDLTEVRRRLDDAQDTFRDHHDELQTTFKARKGGAHRVVSFDSTATSGTNAFSHKDMVQYISFHRGKLRLDIEPNHDGKLLNRSIFSHH